MGLGTWPCKVVMGEKEKRFKKLYKSAWELETWRPCGKLCRPFSCVIVAAVSLLTADTENDSRGATMAQIVLESHKNVKCTIKYRREHSVCKRK